jgi:endonuclease YncB( thermonuclease family)
MLVLSASWPWPVSADEISYVPLALERVIDGDTFVASGLKIRLWGINAPERDEPLYANSRAVLEHILESGDLSCSKQDTDRYGRAVMQCLTDTVDVGALMVRSGFARDYQRYSKGFYADEEDAARQAAQGIWQ